jgi:tRNA(Arg) A34 adenosine deaminase TadA
MSRSVIIRLKGGIVAPAEQFLSEAIRLARENVRTGGKPFGAVIVKDGEVVATGVNEELATNDPTAHAELLAIRAASQTLGTSHLAGCVMYATTQPCPMCRTAMYWAGLHEGAYAYSNEEGEPYGFSSPAVSAELAELLADPSSGLRHLRVRPGGEDDLYELWRAARSG